MYILSLLVIQVKSKNTFKIPRSVVVYCCILLCFGLLPVRLLYLNLTHEQVSSGTNSKSIILSQSRGIIYDKNMQPLAGSYEKTASVVKPTVNALVSLKRVLDTDAFNAVSNELQKSNPVLLNIGNSLDCTDVVTVPVYKRYNTEQIATHIIGYLDSGETHGISGIEKSFDEYLNSCRGELRARFFVDANGGFLYGADVEIVNNKYHNCGGVVLTLEKDKQLALEEAMDICGIEKGAAVMLNVNTGAVAAMVSRPDFDRNNISAAMNNEKLPLFNRVLGSYPIGSVFKPLVAAAALEDGCDPADEYCCNGYVTVGSNTFRCTASHGKVNMAAAIAYSCNCYFVNLIEKTGAENVIDSANELGFGESLTMAEGISTYSGYLPTINELDSPSARALFSFGQGSITANILQVASLYSAIAAGGKYSVPYLVEGLIDEKGEMLEKHEAKAPYRVFSEKTADLLSAFLELAVREGTGKNAAVENIRVCGKTATAQTGSFSDGNEKLVTWFAGFYPYEKPEYVLVVMCEDGISGSEDCAPVFSKAVSKILNNK